MWGLSKLTDPSFNLYLSYDTVHPPRQKKEGLQIPTLSLEKTLHNSAHTVQCSECIQILQKNLKYSSVSQMFIMYVYVLYMLQFQPERDIFSCSAFYVFEVPIQYCTVNISTVYCKRSRSTCTVQYTVQ